MFFNTNRIQSARLLGVLSLGWLLATLTGCTTCKCSPWYTEPGPPPVKDALVWWDEHLHVTPDPVHGGAPLTGLAGRVYLFAAESKQLAEASGNMVVEMYDMTGGEPVKLVAVTYDKYTLKRMKNKDQIGEGYTLFIPWETYNPAVKELKIEFAYMPEQGDPYYKPPIFVSLKTPSAPPVIQGERQHIVPVAGQQ